LDALTTFGMEITLTLLRLACKGFLDLLQNRYTINTMLTSIYANCLFDKRFVMALSQTMFLAQYL
jgi:hypothetical protein